MANGLASQKSLFYVLGPLSVLAAANESSALLLLSQSEARVSPDGDAPRILRPRLGPLRPYEAPRPRGERESRVMADY